MTGLVYRVQDAMGRGPWKPGFSHTWVEDRPAAELHGMALRRMACLGHVGHGCTSPGQLRRWFSPGEYRTLLGYGYRAVKMEVDALLVASSSQCAFLRIRPLHLDVEPFELYPHVAGASVEARCPTTSNSPA